VLTALAVLGGLQIPAQSQRIEDWSTNWSTNLGLLKLDKKGNGNYAGTFNGNKLYGRKDNSTKKFFGSWINKKQDGLRCLYPIDGSYYWGRVQLNFDTDNFRGQIGVCDFPPRANWTGRRSGAGARAQRLKLVKIYNIYDDETPFSSYERRYSARSISKPISVDRGSASHFKTKEQSNTPLRCAGGEVSLEDWDKVEVDQNGFASLWIAVELYEGISCDSGDLDGEYKEIDAQYKKIRRNPFLRVPPGTTYQKQIRVHNTDEGDDSGYIRYTLTNTNE